jgi:hypothetical protein
VSAGVLSVKYISKHLVGAPEFSASSRKNKILFLLDPQFRKKAETRNSTSKMSLPSPGAIFSSYRIGNLYLNDEMASIEGISEEKEEGRKVVC